MVRKNSRVTSVQPASGMASSRSSAGRPPSAATASPVAADIAAPPTRHRLGSYRTEIRRRGQSKLIRQEKFQLHYGTHFDSIAVDHGWRINPLLYGVFRRLPQRKWAAGVGAEDAAIPANNNSHPNDALNISHLGIQWVFRSHLRDQLAGLLRRRDEDALGVYAGWDALGLNGGASGRVAWQEAYGRDGYRYLASLALEAYAQIPIKAKGRPYQSG